MLRQVLFSGLDDVIGFGKVFTGYEQAADGARRHPGLGRGNPLSGQAAIPAGRRRAGRRDHRINTTVLDGDLAESVTQLKQDPELNLLMHGYGPVAKTLLRHGLLDELILWVHPMLAGVGTTQDMIFTEELNVRLNLLEVYEAGSSHGASAGIALR